MKLVFTLLVSVSRLLIEISLLNNASRSQSTQVVLSHYNPKKSDIWNNHKNTAPAGKVYCVSSFNLLAPYFKSTGNFNKLLKSLLCLRKRKKFEGWGNLRRVATFRTGEDCNDACSRHCTHSYTLSSNQQKYSQEGCINLGGFVMNIFKHELNCQDGSDARRWWENCANCSYEVRYCRKSEFCPQTEDSKEIRGPKREGKHDVDCVFK